MQKYKTPDMADMLGDIEKVSTRYFMYLCAVIVTVYDTIFDRIPEKPFVRKSKSWRGPKVVELRRLQ